MQYYRGESLELHYVSGGSVPNQHDIVETEENQVDAGYRTVLGLEWIDSVRTSRADFERVKAIIRRYKGTLLLDPGMVIKAVFLRTLHALGCAGRIKHFLAGSDQTLDYRIAVVAGKPVDEHHDQFFGYALDLSEKLLKSGRKGKIRTTRLTLDLLSKEDGSIQATPTDMEVLSQPDEAFLYQVTTCIENKHTDPDFNSDALARESAVSRSQLFRLLRKISGYTPNTLIREIRLRAALKQLDQHADQVAQIAYNSGFNSPSYFAKVFAQRFHLLPSEYTDLLAD